MKALAGCDLSNCANWIRVFEITYQRQGENDIPEHDEICTVFLANVVPLWQTVRSFIYLIKSFRN
jgi:hypothetical protein